MKSVMNKIIGKSWRDAASLVVLTKRNSELLSRVESGAGVNYDILLQTRPKSVSFANSVVFPGGACEPADGATRWLDHLSSFGYTPHDLETLHRPGSVVSPVFQNNPVKRHIELRITAIRETFEELGLLICSRTKKSDRSGTWADTIWDIDLKHWQKRVSSNSEELYNLCVEHKCYPDIWSLHYWSNWLTPADHFKRYDTTFFVTALQSRPALESSSEVVKVEWLRPVDVLNKKDRVLFPPQVYELHRLSHVTDIEELITFARNRSGYGTTLYYPFIVKTKDGTIQLLPGDDLYPSRIEDYNDNTVKYIDKTILELRESCQTLHRVEINGNTKRAHFILQNYKPEHHINMGDVILPADTY